jgi:hypothetical protein
MRLLTLGCFVSLVLVGVGASVDKSQKKIAAMLIEAPSTPICVGLDCPPWPVPDDFGFCFEAEGAYYTGMYFSRALPWATKGKKLSVLKGQSVEIVVTEKEIRVVDSRIKVKLRRIHGDFLFQSDSCRYT